MNAVTGVRSYSWPLCFSHIALLRALACRRADGVEKQIRFSTQAALPVCYQSEPDGQFLYILPDAVTAYTDAAAAAEARRGPSRSLWANSAALCVGARAIRVRRRRQKQLCASA